MDTRRVTTVFFLCFVFLLPACQPRPVSITPTVSTPAFARRLSETGCNRDGTLGQASVPEPAHGFPVAFQYYLPPCYDELVSHSFPTIYFISDAYETEISPADGMPISTINRLIRADRIPPAILLIVQPEVGVGFHISVAEDLIPYIDARFRTLPDRQFRAAAGYSHTAAIAARLTFRYPALVGSVGVFSGGIDPSEIPQFESWVEETPQELRPRILFDIGDQDPIIALMRNLTNVLDQRGVPYDFHLAEGGHGANFSPQMESYIIWFADAWEITIPASIGFGVKRISAA